MVLHDDVPQSSGAVGINLLLTADQGRPMSNPLLNYLFPLPPLVPTGFEKPSRTVRSHCPQWHAIFGCAFQTGFEKIMPSLE